MSFVSFTEVLVIAVVVLIVFGPRRLPEIARKGGELAARAKRASDQLRREIEREVGEVTEPLTGIKRDVADVSRTLRGTARDLERAGRDAVAARPEPPETPQEPEEPEGGPG